MNEYQRGYQDGVHRAIRIIHAYVHKHITDPFHTIRWHDLFNITRACREAAEEPISGQKPQKRE